MKRTFLSKRNSLLSSANISWNIGVLAFALVILFIRLLTPNFFWYVFTPIFKSADALSSSSHSFIQSFNDTSALVSLNEQLTNENATLASENQALTQKMSSIGAFSSVAGILAGIVARPPESPYDVLVVAAGTNRGVVVGMEVFGPPVGESSTGNVPLGVVTSTTADFSRVTLFSSSGMNTLGWVGHTNVSLTISGAGAGAMNAVVSRSAGIAAGDIVSVPGPGMLPIGVVTRVDSDISSPSVTLRIQPALNLFSLSWVLIRDTGI